MRCAIPVRLIPITIATIVLLTQGVAPALSSDEGSSGKPWLGTYVGASIPGYVVRSTFFVESSGSGKVQKGITTDVIKDLMAACRREGGLALINYRVTIGIGRVPYPTQDGKIATIDPGIFMQGIGDCVDKVEMVK